MKALKRAALYLIRKRGRTVLLTVLLLLMSCCVMIGFSFKKNTEQEADRLRKSLATGFIMEVNTENEFYHKHVDNHGAGGIIYVGPLITGEMIENILSVDGVKDYAVQLSDLVWTDLKLRPGAWAAREPEDPKTYEEKKKMGYFAMSEDEIMLVRSQTMIWPCRNGAMHKNFRTGAVEIAEGRNIEEGDRNKAVISEWLAEHNHVSVGDTFTIETREGMFQPSQDPMKTWGEPVTLEIVGIYHMNFSQPPSEYTCEDGYVENRIYTDLDTHAKCEENLKSGGFSLGEEFGIENGSMNGYSTVEFMVEDPGKLDSMIEQLKNWDALDLENIEITVDSSAYQASVKPYQQIRIFSFLLLAVGICGIGFILFMVLKLWMQGRRHEVGILFSLGMGKAEIFAQMLMECLLVSAAALVLAFGLSVPVLDRCAAALEHMTAPKADAEAYTAAVSSRMLDIEITKTASDEVVLEHGISGAAVVFAVIFVCGISAISIWISFAGVSSLEPKKMLV